MHYEQSLSIIDRVQEYLKTAGFDFHIQADNTIYFDVVGRWHTYRFVAVEKHDQTEVYIQCSLTFVVPATYGKQNKILILSQVITLLRELFDLIHETMPLGTFHTIPTTERTVTVNWVYRLRMSEDADELFLEDILDEVTVEVDEYYPALTLVLTGTVSAQEAYDVAIPEAYGTA